MEPDCWYPHLTSFYTTLWYKVYLYISKHLPPSMSYLYIVFLDKTDTEPTQILGANNDSGRSLCMGWCQSNTGLIDSMQSITDDVDKQEYTVKYKDPKMVCSQTKVFKYVRYEDYYIERLTDR